MVLEIMPQGLLYCGLPCASYSWMSSSRHSRTRSNPLGNQDRAWVKYHNLIGFRVGLILILAIVRKVHVVLEHPRGSALPYVPWLCNLFQLEDFDKLSWKWLQCRFYMASFGSWAPKPSMLIGTTPYVAAVAKRAGAINKQVRKAQTANN